MQFANNYEEYSKNETVKKILNKVCNRYLKYVCSKDEIESLKMTTLWKCSKNFNNNTGKTKAKFTSYLYKSIKNNAKRLKKKKDQREIQLFDFVDVTKYNPDIQIAHDILDSIKELNPELHEILILKYYYRYTNTEIGKIKGYTKEYARIKLKKAIELCRQIVYSNVG